MPSSQARFPAPSAQFFALLLVLGSLIGLGLLILGAPLWVFYFAPILFLPLLIHQLRGLGRDSEPTRNTEDAARARIVVAPDDGHWVVQKPGISRAGRRYDSQADAMAAARGYLRNRGGGEVIAKTRDGKIRAKDTIRPARRRSSS